MNPSKCMSCLSRGRFILIAGVCLTLIAYYGLRHPISKYTAASQKTTDVKEMQYIDVYVGNRENLQDNTDSKVSKIADSQNMPKESENTIKHVDRVGEQKTINEENILNSSRPDNRAEKVQDSCHTMKSNEVLPADKILIYQPMKLAMCYVPKAGCTYWKRVFLMLDKARQTGKIGDALSIDREFAHAGNAHYLRELNRGPADQTKTYMQNAKRFIFVRDPYSRLFSCYVEKFYLSDAWNYGAQILRKLRKDPTIKCGHPLTFTDFLTMATDDQLSKSLGPVNEHWTPISTLCKPCTANYEYIGKVETFDADREFIMAKLGLDSYVKSNVSKEDTAYDLMSKGNWFNIPHIGTCMKQTEYIHRIYKSYQIQGYVPFDTTIAASETMTKAQFVDIVFNRYKERKMTLQDWDKQRRQALVDGYKEVPASIKEAVIKKFQWDFKLFGYDTRPKDIFP